MPQITHKFVVVALDTHEALVWATGVAPGNKPEHVFAPDHRRKHRHVRGAQLGEGQMNVTDEAHFFESIVSSISDAGEILLIGHGNGKANAPTAFRHYLEKKHHGLAAKVAAVVDSDLSALTDAQVLAVARHWFDTHERP